MERKEKLTKAVQEFQKQYPQLTSGDLQTFVLGLQACEEIMQAEIDFKKEAIEQLINEIKNCLNKQQVGIEKTEVH